MTPRVFDIPRWIDGSPIIDRGMAHHVGKNGRPLSYKVGQIQTKERKDLRRA